MPNEDIVVYRGMMNLDHAGLGMAPIMYPAPSVAGFLAALITHGVILDAARNAEKTRIQALADRVLIPYQSLLASYKLRELAQQALEKTTTVGNKRLAEPSDIPGSGLLVEIMPVFTMTQDQTAIVLDNAIVIYAPGDAKNAAYKNIVRVVSRTQISTDLVDFWNANEGAALKAESARLLAESVDLALGEMADAPGQGHPHRTVRYIEGREERMERGQVIKAYCDRVILKNLRGWIMSVGVKPGAGDAAVSCVNNTLQ